MKPPQFIVTVTLSVIPLFLVIYLIVKGPQNQNLQMQVQAQQQEINSGSMAQQIGTSLLKDIGQASLKDEKLKDVLSENGFTIKNSAASPTPSSSSATPAKTP